MTNTSRVVMISVAVVAAIVLAMPAFAQGNGEAKVRVAHLSPDAPNVDFHVNDEPVDGLQNVAYGVVSTYLQLPAGMRNVKVYAAGETSEPLIDADIELRNDATYTLAAVGLVGRGSLEAQVYEDDTSLPAEDEARLRVIHAAPDVDSVDIGPENSDDLFTNLGFPNATRYVEVPAGTYPLEGTLTGSDEVAFKADAALAPKTVYTAFGIGLAKQGTFEVKLIEDAGEGGGLQNVEPVPETGGMPLVLPLVVTALLFVSSSAVAWRVVRRAADRRG